MTVFSYRFHVLTKESLSLSGLFLLQPHFFLIDCQKTLSTFRKGVQHMLDDKTALIQMTTQPIFYKNMDIAIKWKLEY